MNDWLIDDDRLPRERRSLLPGEGFFYPDSLRQEQEKSEAAESLTDAETAVVADTDADGLACVGLVREACGEAALVPSGPHEIRQSIEWVAECLPAGATVFVCDLCPDSPADIEGLDVLADRATVRWFDHHQWEPAATERVREAGVELVVGDSDEECSADVTLRSLPGDVPDRFADLAAVTRDHDLWLKEDPRSDGLADYAY